MPRREVNWKLLVQLVYKNTKIKDAQGNTTYLVGYTMKGFQQETFLTTDKGLDRLLSTKIYSSNGKLEGVGLEKLPWELRTAIKVNYKIQLKNKMVPERRLSFAKTSKRSPSKRK